MPLDYTSQALALASDQIRLLRLHPGDDESEIVADLEVHDLEKCPPYVAISYTWGDVFPTLVISINGHPFRVRMNCWHALWQMRHHGQHTHFWIDSICIDQSNIAEKNIQVANMGSVYRNAVLTACCLGPGRHLSAAQRFLAGQSGQSGQGTFTRNPMRLERDSLNTLQYHPYFRRIWIKQELILSQNIGLFCGVDCVDWEVYEEIWSLAEKYDIQHAPRRDEVHRKSTRLTDQAHRVVMQERRARYAAPDLDDGEDDAGNEERDDQSSNTSNAVDCSFAEIWGLIQQFGASECQDPHDKVYALLPLLHYTPRLTVAYEKPLLALCLELVEGYLQEYRDSSLPPHTFPIATWFVVMYLIHEAFQLTLRDPGVEDFISERYRFVQRLEQPANLRERIGTLEYVPADVLSWFTIEGLVADIPHSNPSAWDEEDREEDDIDEENVIASISEAMPVRDTLNYLATFDIHYNEGLSHRRDRDEPPFTAGLRPELQVKLILIHKPALRYIYRIYLVSADVEVGDKVVFCIPFAPTTTGCLAPIVRPYTSPSSPEARYSYLLGWALQIGRDATMAKNVEVPMRSGGGTDFWARIRDAEDDVDARPFERFEKGDMIFNFWYEDLILHAILLSDVGAVVTAPRTHGVCPSFLAEFLVDEEGGVEDTSDGDIDATVQGSDSSEVGFK